MDDAVGPMLVIKIAELGRPMKTEKTAPFNATRVTFKHSLLVPLIVVGMLLTAPQTQAGDFVVGLGADNFDDSEVSEAFSLQLEYHANPFAEYSRGSFSFMGAAEFDGDSDLFLGVGVSTLWHLSDNWFFESSFAPGYYDEGSDGKDLGGNLQFRTLIGFGYHVSQTSRISIAFDHLSNAGIEDVNPGREAIYIRYARSF